MIKNILKIIIVFIIGIVGGIFSEQIFWPYFIERPLFYEYQLENRPIHLTETIYIQENVAMIEVIEKTEKAIIGVKTELRTGKIIEGGGLAITSDGLIVTLAELIPQGEDFSFFVNKEKVSFKVLRRDLKENLALVKLEKNGLPTVSFANIREIKRGQRVFLSGIIFENKIPQRTANQGIIKRYDENVIYTSIFDNLLGSSLFDVEGNALGLNTVNKAGEIETISIETIKQFAGF